MRLPSTQAVRVERDPPRCQPCAGELDRPEAEGRGALDLPLKILVAEDAAGKVWISYNAPAYLQTRHHFPPDLLPNIAVIEVLAAKAAE